MDNLIFFVGDEPYCLWEVDLQQETLRFLKSIDTEYIDYLLEVHLEAEDEARAASSIRIAYHHSLETLFSFLCALLQVPSCPQAWISKCSNSQLRLVVKRIEQGDQTLQTPLSINQVNWLSLARVVVERVTLHQDRKEKLVNHFADLWSRLAAEFVDEHRTLEYNSIKHGFRVSHGGFALSAGLEYSYGVSPPEEEMKPIGASEFGTGFKRIRQASSSKGERGLRTEQISINWKIEKIAPLLQLISMSLCDVVRALRLLNGDTSDKIRFVAPQSYEDFQRPWSHEPPINNFTMKVGENYDLPVLTKKMILQRIEESV